jgi:hypothetical protein
MVGHAEFDALLGERRRWSVAHREKAKSRCRSGDGRSARRVTTVRFTRISRKLARAKRFGAPDFQIRRSTKFSRPRIFPASTERLPC